MGANGAGVIASDPVTTWCKATVALQCANSPNAAWTIGIGKNTGGANPPLPHKMGFGVGGSVVAGPFILSPGEQIMASVVGGAANDTVAGSIFGVQGIDPSSLDADTPTGAVVTTQITGNVAVGNFPNQYPVLNVGGTQLQTNSPPTQLAAGSVGAGLQSTVTVPVQTGCHALGILVSNANTVISSVKGHQTGVPYPFTGGAFGSTQTYLALIVGASDSSIDIVIAAPGGGGINYWIDAILDPEIFQVVGAGQPQSLGYVDYCASVARSTGVHITVNAGATATIVGGAVNQRIRPLFLSVNCPETAWAKFRWLDGGNPYTAGAASAQTAGGAGMSEWSAQCYGAPLTSGNNLNLINDDSASHNFDCTAIFAQF